MPIYEYECGQCGHTLDALQKISESPLRKCPECGRMKLRRLVSAPKFRLKGGGWYETDFKTDNKRNLADGGETGDGKGADDKKDKPADKASDGGDGKKADSTGKEAAKAGADAKKRPTKPDGGKAA